MQLPIETEQGADTAEQYLTYRIGDELYAMRIRNVREIRGWDPVARIPNTPAYVKGILNLRGTAVPVIDMRLRLAFDRAEYDRNTVVVVVRSEIGGVERIAAMVVDAVADVISAGTDDIRQTPDFGGNVDTEFITGLVDFEDEMVMLYDIDGFMQHPDLYQPVRDDPGQSGAQEVIEL